MQAKTVEAKKKGSNDSNGGTTLVPLAVGYVRCSISQMKMRLGRPMAALRAPTRIKPSALAPGHCLRIRSRDERFPLVGAYSPLSR
jgi:hypothetical protein